MFLASGFDGASMNDIARSAGVSKGTLYAYFESKEDLFKEIIREQKAQTAERLCAFSREGDVRDMLADFGRRLMRQADRPGPHLARLAWSSALRKNFPPSAARCTRPVRCSARPGSPRSCAASRTPGVLRFPDPERAAWQFIDLCQSSVYKQVLFGVVERAAPKEIEATVGAAVDVFLKAYGT